LRVEGATAEQESDGSRSATNAGQKQGATSGNGGTIRSIQQNPTGFGYEQDRGREYEWRGSFHPSPGISPALSIALIARHCRVFPCTVTVTVAVTAFRNTAHGH